MPQISGNMVGTISAQMAVAIPDAPLHALVTIVVRGQHRSSDPLWNRAKLTYWGQGDLLGGNGVQSGYFQNEHSNGDTTFGVYEGQIKVEGLQSSFAGTWNLKSGTGRFAGITGGGKFEAHTPNPVSVEMSWSGEYTLGEGATPC